MFPPFFSTFIGWRLRSAIALLLLTFPLLGHANPQGETVRHGAVTFERQGSELRVSQQSQKAIIDWQSFSIPAGHSTLFLQPNSAAAALNRVRGANASRIDGLLQANGRVYLINPNGIIVGPGGRIDAAGFIGSTLDLPDSDFLAGGDLNFSGTTELGVINLGSISAFEGDLFLIGPSVENHGSLSAPAGTVGLAAGNDVLIQAAGHERVFVRGTSAYERETGVLNTGDITANIAELKAHGGNVYGMAVRNEGRIAATGVSREGGQIFLRAENGAVSNSGTLTARKNNGDGGRIEIDSGPLGTTEVGGRVDAASDTGQGGEIVILGGDINVLPGAILRADGFSGGGDIFLGGGFRGGDATMHNARSVTVGQDAVLSADALGSGNGGRIVAFARDTLKFNGRASATGGPSGGDGGFVELSGQRRFEIPSISQQVQVTSPMGSPGTLLIDPFDILILPGFSETELDFDISETSPLYAGDLSIFLSESNLYITTFTEGEQDDPGDITVAGGAAIEWTSPTSLTLDANRDILFEPNTSIEGTGGGNIYLEAGRSIVTSETTTLGATGIPVSSISSDSPSSSFDETPVGDFPIGGDFPTDNGDFPTSPFGGNIEITAPNITLAGQVFASGNVDLTIPNFEVPEPGNIEVLADIITERKVSLQGGPGDDRFIARVPLPAGTEVMGNGGTNLLWIDASQATTPQAFEVMSGQLAAPNQILFQDIQWLQLDLGSGNDTVNSDLLGFNQQLDGGGGLNDLVVPGLTPVGSGIFGNIDYMNFGQAPAPPDGGPVLGGGGPPIPPAVQILLGPPDPPAGPGDLDPIPLLTDPLRNTEPLPGDNVAVNRPGAPSINYSAFILDPGTLDDPAEAGVIAELLRRIREQQDGEINEATGPVRIDLRAIPNDPLLRDLLEAQLSPAAAVELLQSLGLAPAFDLNVKNGPVVIAVPPDAAKPAIVILLERQLTAEAEAELLEALEDE